jgi:energy-coupling factor transporter ATP-binding protein EcfA2
VPGDFRIAIAGSAGSGKDTLSEVIQSIVPDAYSLAFADDLKLLCADMINDLCKKTGLMELFVSGANVQASNDHRELLRPLWQWAGTDLIRSRYPYYWINRVAHKINSNPFNGRVIITDCRFENEAEWAIENEFMMVKVVGRNRAIPDHDSERHVVALPATLEYKNIGTIDDMRNWANDVLIPEAVLHLRKRQGEKDAN